MNPIGVHFIPKHTGQHHYEYIAALRPGLAKLVGDSTPDVQLMADMYAAAPNALHIWRNHALSEQHDSLWRDPVGTAHRHVTELHTDIQLRYRQAAERGLRLPPREQVLITGVNEPVIELFPRNEDMSNYGDWLRMMRERTPILDAYMYEFGIVANNKGYGAELGNFSSGQPANLKPSDYATFAWFPKTGKLLEQTRGRNALAVNEYWRAETGPQGWWDWHTHRFAHYDLDCDIDVLECGVDQQITGDPPNGNRGWLGHMEAAAYVAQHEVYVRRLMTDPRFRGATAFSLDGGDAWTSFYIEPCTSQFVDLARKLETTVASAPTVTLHIPAIQTGTSTSTPSKPDTSAPATGALDPHMLEAILNVESGGRAYGATGKLLIRFESHIFRSHLGNDDVWGRHFRADSVRPWVNQEWRRNEFSQWMPIHTGNQADEWAAFELATELNRQAAMQSISMGAGQIMGFNAKRIGYPDAQAMFSAFQRSPQAQTIGLINFVLSDSALVQAVRARDYRAIAKLYNGSGQIDVYAPRLEAAYKAVEG
jgi:hypothetical protein